MPGEGFAGVGSAPWPGCAAMPAAEPTRPADEEGKYVCWDDHSQYQQCGLTRPGPSRFGRKLGRSVVPAAPRPGSPLTSCLAPTLSLAGIVLQTHSRCNPAPPGSRPLRHGGRFSVSMLVPSPPHSAGSGRGAHVSDRAHLPLVACTRHSRCLPPTTPTPLSFIFSSTPFVPDVEAMRVAYVIGVLRAQGDFPLFKGSPRSPAALRECAAAFG